MLHLIRKLENFAPLSEDDRRKLKEIGGAEEKYAANRDLVVEGERPRAVFVLTSGLACRYKYHENGNRQILSFLLPGDICDLHVFLLKEMDHSIGTLAATTVSPIRTEDVVGLFLHHPRISAALWWCMLQEEAILRERIVALGRRDAESRIAYLLCEILWRMAAVGENEDGEVQLPLTQQEFGDTLSLTPSYVNRILQSLRRKKLISLSDRVLTVHDPVALAKLASFNSRYLHLDGAPAETLRYLERFESER